MDRATLVKKFEEIAFVWLVPLHLVGWKVAEVKSIDGGAGEELLSEYGIVGDPGNHKAWADGLGHFRLRDFDHRAEGEHEFGAGEVVFAILAVDQGGTEEGASADFDYALAACAFGHLGCAGDIEFAVEQSADPVRHLLVCEGTKLGVWVVKGHGFKLVEAGRNGFRDGFAVTGHHDGRAIDATPAAVGCDGFDHEVEMVFPLLDAVFADEDFAVSRTVHADASVTGIFLRDLFVAEENATSYEFRDFGGACM